LFYGLLIGNVGVFIVSYDSAILSKKQESIAMCET
jgi:hypothetical protein